MSIKAVGRNSSALRNVDFSYIWQELYLQNPVLRVESLFKENNFPGKVRAAGPGDNRRAPRSVINMEHVCPFVFISAPVEMTHTVLGR